ncbi:MAG: heme lyase CcmF/NrfE family subunit, partial [Ilumatobacteraceae bacterium]
MLAVTSLNGVLGHSALIVGLAAAIFGALGLVTAVRTGNRALLRVAPRYAWMCLGAAVAAFAVMERALINRDWSLLYVQQVGSKSTPLLFNVTALWSALEGSILLWVLVLMAFTAAVMHRYRRRLDDTLVAWAMIVMFTVAAFFFFIAFGPADAFKSAGAPDFTRCCLGPNPLLQNHVLV